MADDMDRARFPRGVADHPRELGGAPADGRRRVHIADVEDRVAAARLEALLDRGGDVLEITERGHPAKAEHPW